MTETTDIRSTEEKVRRILGQDGLDLVVGGLALDFTVIFFVISGMSLRTSLVSVYSRISRNRGASQ